MKLIVKFNPRMEFSDASSGFFGGLSEVFDQLAREEVHACNLEGIDVIQYPPFGYHNSDAESIRAFYAAWGGFATRKSFSWKDTYRYSEAPDRRVRRLMEKENKRFREDAIREFNDAVRSLVAFAKKRDPRYKKTAQSEEERQKLLRESAAAQAARSRKANNEKLDKFIIPEWARTEEQPEDGFDSVSESELEQDYYECVVCNKGFKSEKQFEAHERSKKHKKALKQLRYEMKADDRQLNLNPLEFEDSKVYEHDHTHLPSADVEDISNDNGEDDGFPGGSDANINEPITPSNMPDHIPIRIPEDLERGKTDASDTDSEDEEDLNTKNSEHSRQDSPPIEERLAEASMASEPAMTRKLGKAKQKRAKKAAAEANSQDKELMCSKCKASFPSRSKLFNHIKELGHAQLVAKPQQNKNKRKNQK